MNTINQAPAPQPVGANAAVLAQTEAGRGPSGTDLQQRIGHIEQKYGVEVTELANGNWQIDAPPAGDQRGYRVEVAPLDMAPLTQAEANQAAATMEMLSAEGATGAVADYNDAVAQRNAQSDRAERLPGRVANPGRGEAIDASDPYAAAVELADRQGFTDTPLKRVAAAAASARTGFAVPAEVFERGAFFGGAGAGADLVNFGGNVHGGQGGQVSKIGVAHDTDWFLGYAFGEGPMASLNHFEQQGVIPAGVHGLAASRAGLAATTLNNGEALQQYRAEVAELDRVGLPQSPNYDGLMDAQGWQVDIYGGDSFSPLETPRPGDLQSQGQSQRLPAWLAASVTPHPAAHA